MNDTTARPRIKVAIDWLKGIKMDIPYSKWVMFSVGMYVLAGAIDKVTGAIATILPLLK